MKPLFKLLPFALLLGCPEIHRPTGDGGEDGGDETPLCADGFCASTLDPTPTALLSHDMVVFPDDRVGVVYYARTGQDSQSVPLYEIRYLEVLPGGGVEGPVAVESGIKRTSRLSLAIQGNGEPAFAYMGGFYTTEEQAFWFQNDAYLARRAGGVWTTHLVVSASGEAYTGLEVSDNGFLVGSNAALAFDGDSGFFAYRDCHNGQFPQQDWYGSDLEMAWGSGDPTTWQKEVVIASDANTAGKQGYGNHSRLVVVDGRPSIVGTQNSGITLEGTGHDVVFFRKQENGAWAQPVNVTPTVGEDQMTGIDTGPGLAHDPTLGYVVAVSSRDTNRLAYTRSADGLAWSMLETVWNAGSGGWWPSIAVHPSTHEPELAYYLCDNRDGIAEGSCRTADDQLVLATRIAGPPWRRRTVDAEGGYLPRLGHLADERHVLVYRALATGAMRIAVEE